MTFIWPDGSRTEHEFGSVVRGINHNGKRPIKCIVQCNELDKANELREPLSSYMRTLRMCMEHVAVLEII